ncbi:MAG: hypothetical protein Ct9H90mP30_2490 [Actinomycetota bacterium]|nr:MAG: hypothetical protein Ct9H90mP30_2490 [Actinomycetota bacterium]
MLLKKERYTSKEFMQKEWDGIWSKVWLLGCREDQIPEPGDYICTNIGVESVVIVRQYGGGFKAFHNVCMHRGNRLADEGVGHANPFVCGYQAGNSSDGTFVEFLILRRFLKETPPVVVYRNCLAILGRHLFGSV